MRNCLFHDWSEWTVQRKGYIGIVGTISVEKGFEPISPIGPMGNGNIMSGDFEIQRRECNRCKQSQLRSTKATL